MPEESEKEWTALLFVDVVHELMGCRSHAQFCFPLSILQAQGSPLGSLLPAAAADSTELVLDRVWPPCVSDSLRQNAVRHTSLLSR
jgi:hypothetical protein